MVHKKKINEKGKHQFAFYFSYLNKVNLNLKLIYIDDKDLVHRLIKVVRIQVADEFVLFDRQQNILCKLLDFSKKNIKIEILLKRKNRQIDNEIVYLLPILKKDNLQQAVYSLVEIGVSEICLVETAKSRKALSQKELDRLRKTIFCAAEQSKNYAFPLLKKGETLELVLTRIDKLSDKVLFDVDGRSFFDLRQGLRSKKKYLLIGSEGGLTELEREQIESAGFIVVSLTETVLRAVQAVAISSALFRLK